MTVRNPRLHVDSPVAAGDRITLPEAAGRHVTRVLRLGAGDALTVFDGRGGEHAATITRASRGAVEVEVGAHEAVDRESGLAIELGQGICKGDRMDLVVQKATELGVSAIRPLLCERTVVKLDTARAERRIAHWRAIAVHAAQQSGRTRVPAVAGVETLDTWLARAGEGRAGETDADGAPTRLARAGEVPPGLVGAPVADGGTRRAGEGPLPRGRFVPADAVTRHARAGEGPRLVLSPHAEASLSDLAPSAPDEPVRLLVGPEGGFAPREVERARAAGFIGLRLGPRVLRTETAGLIALGVLQARWGDLR